MTNGNGNGNGNGGTLDLQKVRLTVAQFIALLLLIIGAITGATITTVTTQATAAAVAEMRNDVKTALAEIRTNKEKNIEQDGELREHAGRIQELERGHRRSSRDTSRGGD